MFYVGIPDFIETPSTGWPHSSDIKNKYRHSECSRFQHQCYLLKFTRGTIPSRQISVAQGESWGNSHRKLQLQERLLMCVALYINSHHTELQVLVLKDSKKTKPPNTKKTPNDKKNHKPLKIYFPELWKICCSLSEKITFLMGKL